MITPEQALAFADANKQRMGAMEEFDLRDIDWPAVDHYGHDHAINVSQLAFTIAQTEGADARALRVIRTAAFLHDIGRTAPWQAVDDYAAKRSADMAERYLKPRNANDPVFVSEVCAVIARHAVDGDNTRLLPLRALHDADALDSARFSPNTVAGMLVFRKNVDKLLTEFAKNKDHQMRWLRHRKWG